jgi:NAD(P)-dependent dehydrogenase (short-subunit alcohol dehydrogenase family)
MHTDETHADRPGRRRTPAASGAGSGMSDASESRRVVVTGGSSGIGLATALRFVADGAAVVSLDLAAPPDDSIGWFATDVSDDGSVRAGVAAAVEALGGLDVLVNNAGIGAQGTVEDNSDDQWLKVLDVNVLGMVRVSRAALPPSGGRRWHASSTPARSPRRRACRSALSTVPARVPCSLSPARWPRTTSARASGSTV